MASITLVEDRLYGIDLDEEEKLPLAQLRPQQFNEIIGTDGPDVLIGTAGPDRIRGRGGDDEIWGLAGDDELHAGPGHDMIRGGAGNDLIFGGLGNDELHGGPGNDEIRGQAGNDVIFGGDGNDELHGGPGNDVIRGQAGNDVIFGGAGNDELHGGPGNDWIHSGPGADVIFGGAGADTFVYRALNEGVDTIMDFSPGQGDTLLFEGALTGAESRMIEQGLSTIVQVRPVGAADFTGLVLLHNFLPSGDGNPIDVWYGDVQKFGDPGQAQRWVNILGNVTTQGLTSLGYSLNGGPEQPLGVGANGFRLHAQGDFNVEIAYSTLNPSPVDDTVTIRAVYGDQVFTRDVTIGYQGGQQWPTDYSIEWVNVTNLQDVVQVVDGQWSFDANGVRPAEIGYDRLLVLGDTEWDSYDVRLSFTTHDLSATMTGLGGAIWLGMQWGGHTDNPFGGQPLNGYIPGATFMLNHGAIILRPSEFIESQTNPMVVQGTTLVEDQTYNVLIRNQAVASDTDLNDGLDRTYSIKLWGAGTPEPQDWAISHTMFDQEPLGSFYLNAHHVDVTFGDISFTPLPGSQLLQSQDSLETLLAGVDDAAPASTPARAAGPTETAGSPLSLSDLLASGDDAVALA